MPMRYGTHKSAWDDMLRGSLFEWFHAWKPVPLCAAHGQSCQESKTWSFHDPHPEMAQRQHSPEPQQH